MTGSREPIQPYILAQPHEAEWAENFMNMHLPVKVGPGRGLIFCREGNILAAAYWHNFAAPDVQISFVSLDPRWATRGNIKLVLGFPFVTWSHMLRVTAIVNKRNRRVRKLLKGVGFAEEGVHPELFGSGTVGISYGMTRAWWLNSRWGPVDGVREGRGLAA